MQQLSAASKQSFLPLICFFFYPRDIELQLVHSHKNSILRFLFHLHLKSRPHSIRRLSSLSQSPTLSILELANSVFLDLFLLPFTLVASYSFSCPSWRSSYAATLSCTCFRIFLPSGIQSGEETDVGRQRLNQAFESLFTFTLLIFRTKESAWHKWIQLMKGSDFQSTRTTNSVRLILSSQYSIGNPTLSHVQLCENYIKGTHLLWGLKPVLGSNLIPPRTKFDTQVTVSSHRRRKWFVPLLVFFFRVSSAIADVTWVFAIRACFYISRKNCREASQACYQSALISGTSFSSQWYFPSSGRSTDENVWEIVASSPILGPSRRSSFVRSHMAHFASQVWELAWKLLWGLSEIYEGIFEIFWDEICMDRNE